MIKITVKTFTMLQFLFQEKCCSFALFLNSKNLEKKLARFPQNINTDIDIDNNKKMLLEQQIRITV